MAKETYFKNFTNKQQGYNVSLTLLFSAVHIKTAILRKR
ncbi:MAG: hypothetical protein ACJA17_000134 [Polaribacter sp.]|jgi:hypothetical protein